VNQSNRPEIRYDQTKNSQNAGRGKKGDLNELTPQPERALAVGGKKASRKKGEIKGGGEKDSKKINPGSCRKTFAKKALTQVKTWCPRGEKGKPLIKKKRP